MFGALLDEKRPLCLDADAARFSEDAADAGIGGIRGPNPRLRRGTDEESPAGVALRNALALDTALLAAATGVADTEADATGVLASAASASLSSLAIASGPKSNSGVDGWNSVERSAALTAPTAPTSPTGSDILSEEHIYPEIYARRKRVSDECGGCDAHDVFHPYDSSPDSSPDLEMVPHSSDFLYHSYPCQHVVRALVETQMEESEWVQRAQ